MDRFLIYNNEVVEKEEPKLLSFFTNETVKISQKIWYGFGGIPLFNENITLLENQIKMLRFPLPEFLNDKRELFRITKRMLNKNRLYRSGFINFQLFFNDEGFNFMVTPQPFSTFEFPISEKGILLNYSETKKYSGNKFNLLPAFNESLWRSTRAQNKNTYYQNAILLNEKDAICECVSANIFFIKNDELITPAFSSGCFEDTLRPVILKIASELDFKIIQSDNIKKETIFNVDELFIASEEYGIQWILGVENKRFVHEHSVTIHKKLNEYFKLKVT